MLQPHGHTDTWGNIVEEYLKQALNILKAQASVRVMTEEEMLSFVQKLTANFCKMAGDTCLDDNSPEMMQDFRKSIKEKTIVCLECGKVFKILTKKHLASHGLTPDEYREKWKLKEDTPLVCKGLQRDRRKKMKDMKLWEKRRKTAPVE